jgi:hypothetical protein
MRSLPLFALAVALFGCSTGEVKIGLDVTGTDAAAVTRGRSISGQPVLGSDLALSRVRLLVSEVELHSADASGGSMKGGMCKGGGGSHDKAEAGPFVVELAAAEVMKGAHRDFSLGNVKSGTYGKSEIEIEPLDADDVSEAGPDAADFIAEGASLLIDGTYKGKAFHFAGHFTAENEQTGSFTVGSGASPSIPLTIDPRAWFVDASGAALDPTDPAQHSAIAVGICKTFDHRADASAAMGDGRGGHGHHEKPHCAAE